MSGPARLPRVHAAFLERALPILGADARLVGVAAGGSLVGGRMDEFSDIDLVLAVEPDAYEEVTRDRHAIARALGPLVAAFTGEHVGEPRLLICLYDGRDGDPPLHVDLKFVALPDVAVRVEDPVVLWERDDRLSRALAAGVARWPYPDLRWIEDRFWVWVHYVAQKLGRGELFEAVDSLAFFRWQVLAPLAVVEAGGRPAGVRRLESLAPARAAALEATVCAYDRAACGRALLAAIDLYRDLRRSVAPDGFVPDEEAERVAEGYLRQVIEEV